jgi:hypothetical protein
MSAPRLVLKQPTGWFAAGREFAQALTLLSDGAFKLYVYACLRANRHTGRLGATLHELAKALNKAPEDIAKDMEEMKERAICCVARDGGPHPVLEICDSFWPYQRQPAPGRTLGPETEYVQKIRSLFLAPACVRASFSSADEKLATDLYRRGFSLEQITRAILLGCARKYVSMINAGTQAPITSLQYFSDIIEEVAGLAVPENHWGALRSKVVRLEQQWQKAHPAGP